MKNPLSQKQRLIILIIEVGILCLASRIGIGEWFPPTGDKGFWFYTAMLGLILGSRLDTPFFVKPADVVLYSAPAAIALIIGSSWDTWSFGVKLAFVTVIFICILISIIAACSILTKDAKTQSWQRFSDVCRVLAETLGSPRIIYTFVIAFALYAFHSDSIREFSSIVVAWFVTGFMSPFDGVIKLWYRLCRIMKSEAILAAEGEIAAYQTPSLLLIRQNLGSGLSNGDLLAVHDPLDKTRFAVALDYVGRDEGILLRAVEIDCKKPSQALLSCISTLEPNTVAKIAPDDVILNHELFKSAGSVVGIVAPDTSIERLFFEVVQDEGLEEGRLVETMIGKQRVTYQMVNGLTKEEVVQQKNTHGFARGQAQKIGIWDDGSGRFKSAKWLPKPNSPVFLKSAMEYQPRSEAIGHFPGTDYPVTIKNINELVTHNTAILGILGVGKSMLAIELVERMMAAGIKVVCLDLTNQYASELADFYDVVYENACIERIKTAGNKDYETCADNPEQGGSLLNLSDAFREDLVDFLRSDNPRRLKIYNPSQVTGSKQLSEPKSFQDRSGWHRGAALWSITPVEVTRMVSEAILNLLQDKMSSIARVCLVYEEAHSLVPEFNTVASKSDQEATNGTARAILQGRKYGLGCLLVTQRTANVTKTILNQCNTVFAMRTFDETGKTFLANYIGKDYADSLSSLPERHAVVFGKASSCENPVLIRLNDQDQFQTVFRRSNPPPVLPEVTIIPAVATVPSDTFTPIQEQ